VAGKRTKLGKRRILLSDEQRRRLAVKGKILGRKLLAQVGTIVTARVALTCRCMEIIGSVSDHEKRRLPYVEQGRELASATAWNQSSGNQSTADFVGTAGS
jgi:hypothetical protein